MRYSMILLLLAAMTGCATPYRVETPASFVEIENEWDDYDYRATTADGLVIGLRTIEHEPHGEQAFWLKAITNRMRDRGGYALLKTVDVKSADGVNGKQLQFGHDETSGAHLYYVTLFVTDDNLFLLEAGGTKELMTTHAADVDTAVRTFRTVQ